MVYLSNEDVNKLIKELSKNKTEEAKKLIEKLKSPVKRTIYVNGRKEINRVLRTAFNEKRKVKIRYYSLHNDENTTRIVDIYKIYNGVIACFCHLREEERNFVIDRIGSVAMLDEKYKIPKGWQPESIILDK